MTKKLTDTINLGGDLGREGSETTTMQDSRLVIGAGGTGKTHQLQTWADELTGDAQDMPPSWLVGNPLRAITVDQVTEAIASGTGMIVADDLQWFAADALEALLGVAASRTIVASRRPTAESREVVDLLDLLDEELAREVPATRTGLMDQGSFAAALASIRGHLDAGASAGRAMSSDEMAVCPSAAAIGSARITCPTIIAPGENRRSRGPKSVPRLMNVYTKRPTMTVGRARSVLSSVMTNSRPRKRLTATAKPSGSPSAEAITVAVHATHNDTNAASYTRTSPVKMRTSARQKPPISIDSPMNPLLLYRVWIKKLLSAALVTSDYILRLRGGQPIDKRHRLLVFDVRVLVLIHCDNTVRIE